VGLFACGTAATSEPLPDASMPTDAALSTDATTEAMVPAVPEDAAAPATMDATMNDGGTVDANRVTYIGEVQAVLLEKCGGCHAEAISFNGGAHPFTGADGYKYLRGPGLQGCGGQQLGSCVARVVEEQAPTLPGTVVDAGRGPYCRRGGGSGPVHRDAIWTCLSAVEVATVKDWVNAGMPER
jgi:hypothetical protein